MDEDIRSIIKLHGRLARDVGSLSPDDDLFTAGMSSHASISVMLALEEHFDIEFPDSMLTRDTFSSIASMRQAVSGLNQHQHVA